MTPEEILEKHVYHFSNPAQKKAILKAMEEYARSKWDEACREQRDRCVAQFINSDLVKVNQFSAREYCANAPNPEYKP